MMKRIALALLALTVFVASASAQVVPNPAIPPNSVCSYLASAPTLTDGQASWLRCDNTGALITSSSGGGGTTAVSIANGADVAEGATTDVAVTAGSAGTVSAKLRLMTTQLSALATALTTINTTLGTPFQAGGSIGNTAFAVTQSTSPWVVSGTVTATIVPSSSSAIGITPVTSTAAESSHVLKAGPGNVYSVYAANFNTTTGGWLVLLNAVAAPADGAIVPIACALLSANGMASIQYSPGPPGVFSTGITAVVTSGATCFTKTTGTITAFISGSVQ